MTREEALAMPKDKLLQIIKDQYNRDFPNLVQVELVFRNGTRSAVGNPTCIEVVKKALLGELDRQLVEVGVLPTTKETYDTLLAIKGRLDATLEVLTKAGFMWDGEPDTCLTNAFDEVLGQVENAVEE